MHYTWIVERTTIINLRLFFSSDDLSEGTSYRYEGVETDASEYSAGIFREMDEM
jgi:hypothetical protein